MLQFAAGGGSPRAVCNNLLISQRARLSVLSQQRNWTRGVTRRRLTQLWYAPILSIAIVVLMARVLVFARVLSLEEFARFNIGMLSSSTFCMLACIGLQMILQREWPVYIVRRLERHGLVRAAQCNIVAIASASLGVMTAAALAFAWPQAQLIALGIAHGLSQQMFVIANFERRSRGDPVGSANQNLVRAVILLLSGVSVAIATKSAALVIVVEAAVSMIIAAGIFRGASIRGGMSLDLAYKLALRGLPRVAWRSALVLMIVSIVSFMVFNLDRWIAADRLGAAGFARYAFAWIVLSAAQSAQGVINAAVYPMLARRMAAMGQASARRFCATLSISVFLAGTIAVVPAWIIADQLIVRWFPRYSGTGALILIFLGVAVFRVSDFWSSYLVIIGRERVLLLWNVLLSLLVILLWTCQLLIRGFPQIQSLDIAILAAGLALCCYGGNVILVWRARLA
jgi:O-antigen/teichoic acid export membrane protein